MIQGGISVDEKVYSGAASYVAVETLVDLVLLLQEQNRLLREQVAKSPLCDARRFVRHLEAALRDVWGRVCPSPAGGEGPG